MQYLHILYLLDWIKSSLFNDEFFLNFDLIDRPTFIGCNRLRGFYNFWFPRFFCSSCFNMFLGSYFIIRSCFGDLFAFSWLVEFIPNYRLCLKKILYLESEAFLSIFWVGPYVFNIYILPLI